MDKDPFAPRYTKFEVESQLNNFGCVTTILYTVLGFAGMIGVGILNDNENRAHYEPLIEYTRTSEFREGICHFVQRGNITQRDLIRITEELERARLLGEEPRALVLERLKETLETCPGLRENQD